MKTKYIYNLLLRTLVVGALLFCLGQPKVHAQQVAVKTNGLMWLAMMPNAEMELPYDGAKEMLLVDDVDNKEFLRELLEAMYSELPAPKKKK